MLQFTYGERSREGDYADVSFLVDELHLERPETLLGSPGSRDAPTGFHLLYSEATDL